MLTPHTYCERCHCYNIVIYRIESCILMNTVEKKRHDQATLIRIQYLVHHSDNWNHF
jgi:hypothetical protein